MIIKSADDKSKRLILLDELQKSTRLDARQKDWLAKELVAMRHGMAGERDAAHYIDNHYADSKNYMVLHDLRIQLEGEVAQIDHLVIARGFNFYLLETKTFGGHIVINEQGEFSVRYGNGRVYGIPSPMEQSRRHANVLAKLLQRLEIAGRLRSQPSFEHVVLVHPKATIQRPSMKVLDTGNVIKADQFATWHQKFQETQSVGGVFAAMVDLRSTDTVKEWAEKIARQHRPADPLALPEFMAPTAPPAASPTPAPIARTRTAPSAEVSTNSQVMAVSAIQPSVPVPSSAGEKKLICMQCGSKISYA